MKFEKLTTIFVALAVITVSFPGIFYPQKAQAIVGAAAGVGGAIVGGGAGVVGGAAGTVVGAGASAGIGLGGAAIGGILSAVTGALAFETNPIVITAEVDTAANTTVIAGATTAETSQTLLEWAKRFVFAALKKQIFDVMVDQIVNWIQNGGEPRFVTDWDKFFGNVAQGAVGEFVQQIGAGFLCSPFSLQVRVGLLPVEKFGKNSPYSCTLDQIVGNVENFYKDFRNGGWLAYEEAGKLQNNYYGALWMSWYGRDQFVASKLAAANAKINASGGFLSVELCRDKTGKMVSDEERNAIFNGEDDRTLADITCEDTTPGGYVGATVEKLAGADLDFIINAQDLGDYAAAITNALVNRVIKEGVNGLRGVTGGSAQTGNTPAYYRAEDLPTNLQNTGSDYGSGNFAVAQTNIRGQINAAIADRQVVNTNYTTFMDREKSLKFSLETLKVCLAEGPPQIAVDTQNSINVKNTKIFLTQESIDDNLSEIDLLRSNLAKLNTMTDAQAAIAFSSAGLAQITGDITAAANLKNETTAQIQDSEAAFNTRKTEIQANQERYCN